MSSRTRGLTKEVVEELALILAKLDDPLDPAIVDVTDRWNRELGQIDLVRVLNNPLTAANPVISGVYDAAGNRMPSMDVAARSGYVDVIDRAARLVGVIYGNQGQLAQRAATLEALVDIQRWGGTALTGRDITTDIAKLDDLDDALISVDTDALRVHQKELSCSDVHQELAKGVGDSPVTIVTVAGGEFAEVFYYTIWNNDDDNDADVCLYLGAATCCLFSGHLDPDCGVIANLVRSVKGADGVDVILTIAGSTDVDCIVHAEVT